MARSKYTPHCEPDYDKPTHGHSVPPENTGYPDRRIYGDYASKKPPPYVPHPYEHACFKPREEDYKSPVTCDGDGKEEQCNRKNHLFTRGRNEPRFTSNFSRN